MLFITKPRILFFSLCVFVNALEEVDNVQVTKEFYLSLDAVNFFEAFVNCKEGEMELATIMNEDESAALDSFLDPHKIVGWANGFWLSGTHLIDTLSFQYYWLSTGERAIYTNWDLAQPDNSGGIEHCMQWGYSNGTLRKVWNDYNCNNTLRYVCQYVPK